MTGEKTSTGKRPEVGVEATVCQETTNRGDHRWAIFEKCGKPVKEDGLCGLHLSVRKRRQDGAAKYRANKDADAAMNAEAKALGEKLGIEVRGEFLPFSKSSARSWSANTFVVPADWLRSISAQAALPPPESDLHGVSVSGNEPDQSTTGDERDGLPV